MELVIREKGINSIVEKMEFYEVTSQPFSIKQHTLLKSWNVLKGFSLDNKRLVIMPLREEITQLIKRRTMPKVVP